MNHNPFFFSSLPSFWRRTFKLSGIETYVGIQKDTLSMLASN